MSEIRIIHTCDFHGALTAEKARQLRDLKARYNALLIDSGDAVRAPNVAVLPWRERVIVRMNEAGYDAMGLGNREYFFRKSGMRWKTGHAQFPRLCSNLRAKRGDLGGIEPWTILRASDDARVGFFGLMPTMIEPGHWFEYLSDTHFIEWEDAAREAIWALRSRTDVIVALLHRSFGERPEDFPLEFREVSLVLIGHAHRTSDTLEDLLPPLGLPASFVGARASHARLIGLRVDDKTVTMDQLIALGSSGPAESLQ